MSFAIESQTEIYVRGVGGERAVIPFDPRELEAEAGRRLPPAAFAYLAGGAGIEQTMAANRAAFDRWRIVPRMLRDVSQRDPSIELFGRRLLAPILLAPIGVLELAHPEADLAVARAAAAAGVPIVFSNQASIAMETCAAAMDASPRWFQLYWSKSNELVASLVERAERCGCEAIVVTLDTTMLGWRTRDLDHGHLPFLSGLGIAQYTSDPVFARLVDAAMREPATGPRPRVTPAAISALFGMARRHPGSMLSNLRSGRPRAAVRAFVTLYSRPSLTWEDLAFLRERTKLPILLKGILHPEDARRALEYGMDGIVVSNHGGRQVDGAIAALAALPAVVATIGGRIPVLFDSGVRTGADVFKAVALGARAVLIGRPYAFALAVAGTPGVETLLRNLRAEFELTMGLAGCAKAAEIERAMLAAEGDLPCP